MYCTYCGSQVDDNHKFCTNCGAPLNEQKQPAQETNNAPVYQEPAHQAPVYQQPAVRPDYDVSQLYGVYPPVAQQVPQYPATGLIIWSAICIVLCFLPGIIAFTNAYRINKSISVEQQMKRIKSAKGWATAATIIAVLMFIGRM